MGLRRLMLQPECLVGIEYVPGTAPEYQWFAFEVDGQPYAYAGLWKQPGAPVAWMLWRIVGLSVKACKDLRREVVPAIRAMMLADGITHVKCATDDEHDVDFDKMVRFMGFTPKVALRVGIQEV